MYPCETCSGSGTVTTRDERNRPVPTRCPSCNGNGTHG